MAVCPASGVRVTCVHDGDSIVWQRERIRLENIDTPELDGRCAAERRRAVAARDRLVELLRSGRPVIRRTGTDRHGRTLARVSVNGRDVGTVLVREGHARPWEGRRRPWC
ncbi:thermonuclease family protein [Erythrobacteraceae bacterium CFH 75059]|nr:thermonuclease family protein [Erythrobacteraceae bacterium CFH 75059]